MVSQTGEWTVKGVGITLHDPEIQPNHLYGVDRSKPLQTLTIQSPQYNNHFRMPRITKNKRSKHPQQTKLLVLQFKHLFKQARNMMKDQCPEDAAKIAVILNQETNVSCFRRCLEFPSFQRKMLEMEESGQLLHLLYHSRMQYRNFTRCLKYYNQLLNGLQNPSLMSGDFWTAKGMETEQPSSPQSSAEANKAQSLVQVQEESAERSEFSLMECQSRFLADELEFLKIAESNQGHEEKDCGKLQEATKADYEFTITLSDNDQCENDAVRTSNQLVEQFS